MADPLELREPVAHELAGSSVTRGRARRRSGVMAQRGENEVWCTPPGIFMELDREFGPFEIDVAALPENALCPSYFTPAEDGLAQDWAPHRCWMNPPYAMAELIRWTGKALEESRKGALVVALLPSRTDQPWFQNYVLGGALR